jgi:hypothetical protein
MSLLTEAELCDVPQPCNACGALVEDFHQWFTEGYPSNPQGHQVPDWTALEFEQETIAAAREHNAVDRGMRR